MHVQPLKSNARVFLTSTLELVCCLSFWNVFIIPNMGHKQLNYSFKFGIFSSSYSYKLYYFSTF